MHFQNVIPKLAPAAVVIMGNGASFLRPHPDDDDMLGTDLDGSSKGVIKRIPIEMKPRGKLGNKITNSVLRKPKGGSLRYSVIYLACMHVDLQFKATGQLPYVVSIDYIGSIKPSTSTSTLYCQKSILTT